MGKFRNSERTLDNFDLEGQTKGADNRQSMNWTFMEINI